MPDRPRGPARVLVPPEGLRAGVARLAGDLSAAYPHGVVLVAVLKGGVVFLADLVRAMAVEITVDFMAVSAYPQGTGRVRIVKDLDLDVVGRDVVLVEGVVDTGLSLAYLLGELRRREPRSVEACALVDRRGRRLVPVPLRWVGFEVGEDFVVGYGLDQDERYRNLDLLATADPRAPGDAFLEALYKPLSGALRARDPRV